MVVTCCICDSRKKSSYKCPKCLIPYCSVNCWNIHKNENCEVAKRTDDEVEGSEPLNTGTNYQYTTESTVSREKLKLLENSEGLKQILRNPHLRHIIKAIDSSQCPAEAMENAMVEPIFVEFADECLKVVEPPNEQ